MSYDALIGDFKRYISLEKNLSINTSLSYVGDVAQFLSYCDERNINFASLKREDFERYLIHLKKLGLKNSSLFRKTESIKAFYKFLLTDKRIESNPLSEFSPPKLERKLPHYLTLDEIKKIYDFFSASDFKTLRTCAAIDLLYSAGLRISELSNLTLEDMNLDQGWVRVKGKGSKERIVPVAENTISILKLYLNERNRMLEKRLEKASSYFFVNRSGRRISRVQLWKDIKNFVKNTGIDKNIYPHMFRHTFATHLLHNGADLRSIAEMLGHSSLTTTQVYTHLDKSVIKNIHTRFHPKG
ncbi:MAG: site-specific tyrosine recombinase/integron integrase [Elusimicrobiales bacterium]